MEYTILLQTFWWKCTFWEDGTEDFRDGSKGGRETKALKKTSF